MFHLLPLFSLCFVVFAHSVSAESYPANMTLVYLTKAAEENGAKCLSGTPGAYFWRPGWGSGANKFRIHLRGGGWCFTAEDCYSRTSTNLGNTSLLPSTPASSDGVYGMMSDNESVNADMYNWNTAFLWYCDGTSYTSNRSEPLMYKGRAMYFRGIRILDGFFADLESRAGLYSSASAVVLGGTSAGGLATYIHGNRLLGRVPSSCSVFLLPDAGFFLDHATVSGELKFRSEMQGAWSLWAPQDGLDAECMRLHPASSQWQCLFAQYTYPHLRVPVYVTESMYDTASLGLVLDLGCTPSGNSPGSCDTAQIAAMQAYHEALNATILSVLDSSRDAAWLTACAQHEETCRDRDWAGTQIRGTTNDRHFRNFRNDALNGSDALRIDTTWPNNPTCWVGKDVMHGGC